MGDVGTFELILFVVSTFIGSLVASVAGFAFALVAAAAWLHILSPTETTALIVAFGLIVQGFAVWKLRRALRWDRLLPFVLGAAIGVPLGVALLGLVRAATMRASVGVLLILFSLYSLGRPQLPKIEANKLADGGVGLLNGILGGATGLAGILVTIWCSLRGWARDEQRAVFQPVAVAIFAMTAFWFGGVGMVSSRTLFLFLLGLPALFAGIWLGFKLYGRLDEEGFRKVVLVLLLISGVTLLF